jgi:DNA polymerase III epsilon subunit-like protein
MTMMNPNELTTTYVHLTTLLATEEEAGTPTDAATLHARDLRRHTLTEQIFALEELVRQVRTRFELLPRLPNLTQVRWAQTLLAFPNLAFLEVDTDGLDADADILRIVLVDKSGGPLYAQTFKPRRPLSEQIRYLTALTPEMVEHAPSLAQEWDRVTLAFAGRYVLSFNQEFDATRLRENADRYGLTPLTIIGACLQQAARTYFPRYSAYPKLATVCTQLGFPLPDHPSQDTFDRVRGQIQLLEAMAQGLTRVPSQQETIPDDSEDEDEHLF